MQDMSKQEATRLADALENSPLTAGLPHSHQAAALLRRWPDGESVAWQLSNARVALSTPSSTMAAVYEQDGFLVALKVPYGPPFYSRTALIEAIDGAITKLLSPAPPDQSERIAALEAALERIRARVDLQREPHWAYRNTVTENRKAIRDECDHALRKIEEMQHG